MIFYRLFFFAILFIVFYSDVQAQPSRPISFDSLRQEVSTAQNQKSRIDAYLKLGSAFYTKGMQDSLYYYANHIDTTSVYGLAATHYLRGHAYYRKMNLNAAIASFEKAREILKTENKSTYLQMMNTLGVSYLRTRQNEKAKTTFNQMLLEMGEDDLKLRSSVYGNLGMVYRNLGDYNKAIEYFEKNVTLQPDNPFNVANSYLNIATMFQQLEMYDKAIATLLKVDTASIINRPVYVALNGNLGENYDKSGKYDLAEHHYTIALKKAQELKQFHQAVRPNIYLSQRALHNDNEEKAYKRLRAGFKANKVRPNPPAEIALSLWAAEYFLNINQPDSALYYANHGISIARKTKSHSMLRNVYELMSLAYEQQGATDKSNEYLKKHASFTDSINDKGKLKMLADSRARYNVEETKNALKQTTDEKSYFEKLSIKIGLAAILLLGVSGGLYYMFFNQKKTNILDKEEIETLNKKLKKVNQPEPSSEPAPKRLLLKSKAIVNLNQLMYIKSDGPYLEFHLNNKASPEVDRNTLKSIIAELPVDQFVQVHRSYIVNINYVRSIFSTRLMLSSGADINISRSFKANIEKILIKPA